MSAQQMKAWRQTADHLAAIETGKTPEREFIFMVSYTTGGADDFSVKSESINDVKDILEDLHGGVWYSESRRANVHKIHWVDDLDNDVLVTAILSELYAPIKLRAAK